MGTCSAIINDMSAAGGCSLDFDSSEYERELTEEEFAQQEKRRRRNRQIQRSHNRIYKSKRKALIAAMGGECVECGKKRKLEFHHPDGRDWNVRSMNQWRRIKKYEEEWAAGKIELLCRSCNGGINPKKEREEEEAYDEYADCE
jgi:hypothetical protein